MKLKRFTGLLLTFVMSAACITTGFAEDTADSTEVYETVEETVETEEAEETVYIEDILEETAEEIGAEAVISEEEPAEEEAEEPETVISEDSEEETEAETEAVEETEAVTETETETTTEVDLETETNADLASTVTYSVTGGSIYINTSTGEVTDCDTSVTEATIPSSYSGVAIKSIGSKAFQSCTYLTSVTIPSSVTSMGTSAFSGCTSLTTVKINGSLDSISEGTFRNCVRLANINIPSTVTSIGQYAFYGCTLLPAVTLPSGLTSISKYAFSACTSLTSVSIPSSCLKIYSYAFSGCTGLKTLTINDGVREIGEYAFESCKSLTSVTIPDSMNTLGMRAFYNCTSLKTVTILSLVVTMYKYSYQLSSGGSYMGTFRGCSALTTVYCYTGSTAASSTYYPSSTTISTMTVPIYPPTFTVVGTYGGRNVTFTSKTSGAKIYYSSTTSNLTTSDKCISNGDTVLFEDFYGTIYAKAYYNGKWTNVARLILKIPTVSTPTITSSGNTVTIKCSTPDSYIYYTTNGTTPTMSNGTALGSNSGSFSISSTKTIKAIAVRSCYTNSSVASKTVSVAKVTVNPPSFSVAGVFGGRNVTFSSTTSGAKIYYSTTTSNLTTSDKSVSNGGTVLFEDFYRTVYAKAYYNGVWSNVSRLILKIPTINTPTITYSGTKATIRTTTPNCHIYYTTDGTTPSMTNGKRLSTNSYGQITASSGTTIKAIAVRSCFTNSAVASYKVS
ncbi:MAG: leucine-rich repeat protein [Clostridiales bacterium]|nr:leucine-rich repeat protein [Clostridiales bacterium]